MDLDPARHTYVQVARGQINVNGSALEAGDAVHLQGEPLQQLSSGRDAEVLVFDLAP